MPFSLPYWGFEFAFEVFAFESYYECQNSKFWNSLDIQSFLLDMLIYDETFLDYWEMQPIRDFNALIIDTFDKASFQSSVSQRQGPPLPITISKVKVHFHTTVCIYHCQNTN